LKIKLTPRFAFKDCEVNFSKVPNFGKVSAIRTGFLVKILQGFQNLEGLSSVIFSTFTRNSKAHSWQKTTPQSPRGLEAL
jgi:hypothetical protein